MSKTYKIGEAAALLNLKTYVLRFWETEFPEIAPLRTEKGQRLYAEEHIALLERIRYLLHDRGLTIGGARKALEEEQARGVSYSFGVPGAITRDAARPAKQPAELEQFDLDEEEDGDENFSPAPYIDYPLNTGRLAPSRPLVRRKGQCNLPGIEEPAAVFDDAPSEVADSDQASSDIQGMLPLFSMVRTNPAAPQTAPAGTNFIRATAPDVGPSASRNVSHTVDQATSQSASHADGTAAGQPLSWQYGPAAQQLDQAAPGLPGRGVSPEIINEVIHELQAVAAILQAPLPTDRHAVDASAAGSISAPASGSGTGTGHTPNPVPGHTPDETATPARPETSASFSEPR